jgi:transposase InsO family protein
MEDLYQYFQCPEYKLCWTKLLALIQDDFTGYLWSYFIKAKSELPEKTYDWMKLVQQEIFLNVNRSRLDNSGESISFHQLVLKCEFYVKFEFTANGTPQQSGKVERAFATLFGKTRSMLNAGRITIPFRKGLWANCTNLSVQLENIKTCERKGQTVRSCKVYGTNPKSISNMRTFGEMAIVASHSDKKFRKK